MKKEQAFKPYSLSPKQTVDYSGLKQQKIYDLINGGGFRLGYHYLKIGRSLVIIVEKFVEWVEEQRASAEGVRSQDNHKMLVHNRGAPMKQEQVILRPYSLSPAQCYEYFGIKKKRIYDLVESGQLHIGYHYLKVGKSLVVNVDKFIEWMWKENGFEGEP